MTGSLLKKKLISSNEAFRTREIISTLGVKTVCESSLCPNLNECFSRRHAAFLILGDACTRHCGFCSVGKSAPLAPDPQEPYFIREAVSQLGLDYVVITSVTRDDLDDGGAAHFASVISAIRALKHEIGIEVLVPDFQGMTDSVKTVLDSRPDVFAHNIETVRRLYPQARPGAGYDMSLGLLRRSKLISSCQITKSGIMLGLGESEEEVLETIIDISLTGCDILTIGQYLKPSQENLPVKRYVSPDEFERYREFGLREGFKCVAAGPFVRSSYRAEEMYIQF